MMGKVIAIALQKGGVGKTTTCVNTAAILSEHKKKVLVIDFDGQGNASLGFGIIPEDYIGSSILEVLKGEKTIDECIIHTGYGVDLVPANDYLSGLTVTVISNLDSFPEPMLLLKKKLDQVKDRYDYVFIDMPPELGFFSVNALSAADEVIIPLQCEPRASRGVSMLLKTIKDVKESYNPDVKVMGILPTMFNRNTNVSTTVLQQARRYFSKGNIKIFDTTIYRTVKFSEADFYNKPAVAYSDNEAIQSYRDFVKEVFNVG
jgi:chromosome partitioning protein